MPMPTLNTLAEEILPASENYRRPTIVPLPVTASPELSARPRCRTDVPRIIDWYMEGKIAIDDLITHTMPLDRINDAFGLMHEGKSIRSVVQF